MWCLHLTLILHTTTKSLEHTTSNNYNRYGVALDTLHQYFDYALWHGAFPCHIGSDLKPGTGFVPSPSVSNETKTSSESNPATTAITRGFPRARPAVQYASMCLGALHYVFGHMEEARRSVDESMRVAQDYGDHRCVSFIISCL
mgnify:CR=1 FL=1